jgi:opacity protein-like surface antigen
MRVAKILAAALMLVSSVASAQFKGYGTFEYSDEENRVTKTDSIKGGFVIGAKNKEGLDISAKLESSQAEIGNGNISTGIEARIRKTWNNALGVFSPWAGVRAGEAIKKDDNWLWYAIDAGVKFPIAGSLSGDVGYRYRNSVEQWRDYETHRGHLSLSYAITKQDSVAVRYAQSYGDSETNAWRLSYTRSF